MIEGGFEEKTKEQREAIVNCSKAIFETIQSYGSTATLDLVVRISNYDDIVSAVLPYFPSIARAVMVKPWNKRTDSPTGQVDPEVPPPKKASSPPWRVRRTKKRQKPI
jgi:hypothetical protein